MFSHTHIYGSLREPLSAVRTHGSTIAVTVLKDNNLDQKERRQVIQAFGEGSKVTTTQQDIEINHYYGGRG